MTTLLHSSIPATCQPARDHAVPAFPGRHYSGLAGKALIGAFRALAGLVGDLVKARQQRRQLAEFAAMGDRTLADIGLTRNDVEAAIGASGRTDPFTLLAAFARERREADRAMAEERLARSQAHSRGNTGGLPS